MPGPRRDTSAAGGSAARRVILTGPGLAGKTTTLSAWADMLPTGAEPVAVPAATHPDARFEYLTVPPGAGLPALHLATVPGRLACASERRLLLRGADAVVFVADSRPARRDADLILLDELGSELAESGRLRDGVALLLQYNRRDAADALPLDDLERRLNPVGWPAVPTVATAGDGLADLLAMLLARLH